MTESFLRGSWIIFSMSPLSFNLKLKNKKMRKINLIKNLMFLKASVWSVFAVSHFLRNTEMSFFLGSLMIVDALIFFLIGWKIDQYKKPIYYFALVFIGINILLTIFDQMGVYDFIILFVDLIVFFFLFFSRKVFTR